MIDRLKTILAPLAPLGSLRLTVTLFTLAMLLIFAGTLAQREHGNWEVVQAYFRTWGVIVPLKHLVFYDVPGVVPLPGGLTLCVAILVNLVAAYLPRLQLTWKRAGLLTIHLGLVVMIVGELVTAGFAEEGMMFLREGQTKRHVEDLREVELAVTTPSIDGNERVTVIPEAMLRAAAGGAPIAHPDLPFEVSVETWMPNAGIAGPAMMARQSAQPNPATEGVGKRAVAMPRDVATGVDVNESNQPAAYVTLRKDGQTLGTWMVSSSLALLAMFEPRQDVAVGDQTHQIELRFKRTYLPYSLHLIDATHETFVGTTIPKNFSSKLRLLDPEMGEDRETLVYMNHPLRYRGQTFFQAQMGQATDASGAQVSGLQVVTNPGWLLPYASCLLVAMGLTWHFGAMLIKFAGRAQRGATVSANGAVGRSERKESGGPLPLPLPEGGGLKRVAPAATVAVLALAMIAAQLRPAGGDAAFELGDFAKIPVTAEGRVKPMDTVARSALAIIGGKQTARVGEETLPAVRWMLDVIAKPQAANAYPVFRVDHPDVKALIGVGPGTPGGDEKKRFSFDEIMAHRERLAEQAERAEAVKANSRNAYQKHLLDLVEQLNLYGRMQQMQYPFVVPPMDGHDWRPIAAVVHADHPGHEAHAHEVGPTPPEATAFTAILQAYGAGDAVTFNRLAAEFADSAAERSPGEAQKASFEVVFNRLAPFYQGTVLYVLSFVLAFGAVLLMAREDGRWARRLGVTAVTLMGVGFLVHTFGIAARVYLQGYAPVTNLYSSAVFIGWVAVLVGLLMERVFRNRIATIVASAIGFATLIIAHNLADGDTMQMMQAVLDSNFWLSTHVITVTVGYAATFLAGAFGAAFILVGVYTPYLTKDAAKALTKMMYGTVAFALFFSFVGTVLGGIWADQSWGRFWGWDPKENGAVLIVLMNAIILHARWGGMIRERGVAVLSIVGSIVTLWSWFGTNMLGVGLHSYGFMDSALFWMTVAVIAHLAVASAGLIPVARWASAERDGI